MLLPWIIIFSQAPIIVIYSYVYFRDDKGHEPLKLLLKTFILGALACVPAALLEGFFGIEDVLRYGAGGGTLFVTALLVGLVEEGLKYGILRQFAYKRAEFDEPYDGIMYAASIALGFAGLENFFYVAGMGLSAGITRMFTAVPMHAMCAILMGYEVGQAKFATDPEQRSRHLWRGLLIAVALHALYDFFLFFETSITFFFALIVLSYQFRVTRAAMAQFAAHVPGRSVALIVPTPPGAAIVIAPEQLRNATALLWFTRAMWIFAAVVLGISLLFSDRLTEGDRSAAIGFVTCAIFFIPLLTFVMRKLRAGSRLAWFLSLGIFILYLGTPLFVLGIIGLSGLLNVHSRSYFWGTAAEKPIDITPVAA